MPRTTLLVSELTLTAGGLVHSHDSARSPSVSPRADNTITTTITRFLP